MKVHLPSVWVMEATNEEMRLILRALGGRLKPHEVEEAKNLGDCITQLRALETSTLATQMSKQMAQHASSITEFQHDK